MAPEIVTEFVPLATLTITTTQPFDVGVTIGARRLVSEIADTVWSGERLNARQLGVATADWARVSPEGIGEIDVRSTVKTDDGAIIYVHYQGRLILTQSPLLLYAAPLFETADPRYTWLNAVQAIAKGIITDDGILTYQVFEVK